MNRKDNPQKVINRFAKRQKIMPYVLGGLAGILALLGIFIIVAVATGSGNPFKAIFATKTPTPTATFTPTATVPSPTPSNTPTITGTPEPTTTPTPSGPWYYEVKENDSCWGLADTYDVDFLVLLAINNFTDGTCPIAPGDRILIPAQGQVLPTATPLPTDFPRGTIIEYTVQANETLASIASKFQTTKEDIMTRNDIEDENLIYVGQVLKIRYGIATPTKTLQPTSTLATINITPTATATP